jgi:hypothetical protein
MKLYKQIIIILIFFFKTETLLSDNSLFSVNNIELEKKEKTTNSILAREAIKKGFNQLILKILLKEDSPKFLNLNFDSINQLVKYYKINNISEEKKKKELISFSVTFDKDKIHNLFFKKGISYAEILDKELFILPLLIQDEEISIFNNNYFYKNWNKINEKDLIEFILPIENIEIIQNINKNKNSLINVSLNDIFKEYLKKNLALILIENKKNEKNIYIKLRVQDKNISKSFSYDEKNSSNDNIIKEVKYELINLIKSANLIDVGAPSFLNVELNLNKKNNLVDLNSRIKDIESIENVFVQSFNKDLMNLRIKYLGKLDKLINQLEKENINLSLIEDKWIINSL